MLSRRRHRRRRRRHRRRRRRRRRRRHHRVTVPVDPRDKVLPKLHPDQVADSLLVSPHTHPLLYTIALTHSYVIIWTSSYTYSLYYTITYN